MSTQTNVSTLEQLGQQFTSLFKHRVFRLETLDYYDAENEREPYRRFLAGEPVDRVWREPWKKLVREVRASGRVMERVQVVSEPVTDYQRFALLHGKPASVAAGEDVRILRRVQAERLSLDEGDFWLFDNTLAARLIYDESGTVLRVEMERDPGETFWLAYMRDVLLWQSAPLAQYVAENNITERKHAA